MESSNYHINKSNNRVRSGTNIQSAQKKELSKEGDIKEGDIKEEDNKEGEKKNIVSRFFSSNIGKGAAIGASLLIGVGVGSQLTTLGTELGDLIGLAGE